MFSAPLHAAPLHRVLGAVSEPPLLAGWHTPDRLAKLLLATEPAKLLYPPPWYPVVEFVLEQPQFAPVPVFTPPYAVGKVPCVFNVGQVRSVHLQAVLL